MKKYSVILLGIAIAFTFTSCEELLEGYNTTVKSDEVAFDMTLYPAPVGELEFDVDVASFDLDSLVKEQGIEKDKINSIIIQYSIIEITNKGEGKNFDAFKSLQASIRNTTGNEIILAAYDDIPDGLDSLNMNVVNQDITEILDFDDYQMFLTGSTDQMLTDTLDIRGKMKYNITVKLFEEQ